MALATSVFTLPVAYSRSLLASDFGHCHYCHRIKMMKKYILAIEAVMALVALCWTAALLVESARGQSLYPYIRKTLSTLGNCAPYLIHDSRTLTFRNVATGEEHLTGLHATGLFVINKHPPVGTHFQPTDGEYVLARVERNDMPLLLNVLLSVSFVVFAAMAARRKLSIWGMFAVGRHWYSKIILWLFILGK